MWKKKTDNSVWVWKKKTVNPVWVWKKKTVNLIHDAPAAVSMFEVRAKAKPYCEPIKNLGASSNAPNSSHHSDDCPMRHHTPKIHLPEVLPSIPTKDEKPSFDRPILPDQIIESILLRLPAIELVRLNKLWPTIISSPRFISAHIKHSKSDPSTPHYLLARDHLTNSRPLDSNILCCATRCMLIVGSVNGLICLAGDTRHCLTADDIFILNPVTCLSRKLPSPSVSRMTRYTRSVKLAFWWDDDDDDGVYKVARIVCVPNGPSVLEVWDSSVPDKWTDRDTIDFDFYGPTHTLSHPADVLIEGFSAYWIAPDHDGTFFVLSLDLKTLGCEFTPLSEEQMRMPTMCVWKVAGGIGNRFMCGAIMNGEFVLLRSRFSGDFMFEMWRMVTKPNGGSGWSKCETGICLDFPFTQFLGSIDGKLVVRDKDDRLAMYDLKTRRRTRTVEDSNLKYVRIVSAHDFVGSLVSIEGFESNDLPVHGVTWPNASDFDFNGPYSLVHPCDVLMEGSAAYWVVSNHVAKFFVLSLDLKAPGLKLIPLSEKQMCMARKCVWRVVGGLVKKLMFGAKVNGNFVLLKSRFSGDCMYDAWRMVRKLRWWSFGLEQVSKGADLLGFSFHVEVVLKDIDDKLAVYDVENGTIGLNLTSYLMASLGLPPYFNASGSVKKANEEIDE